MRIFPPNKLEVVDGGEPREVFHTGNTPIQPNATNLILDSGAKLGIGAPNPSWSLEVRGSALVGQTAVINGTADLTVAGPNTVGGTASLSIASGFIASGTLANPYDLNIDFSGYLSDVQSRISAWDVSGSTGSNGVLRFSTKGADGLAERLRIDASGKLLSPNGSAFVGTVSNTGNGSIIERGSNANGEYVKFADGTMICTYSGSLTNPNVSRYTWTFPAPFFPSGASCARVAMGNTGTTLGDVRSMIALEDTKTVDGLFHAMATFSAKAYISTSPTDGITVDPLNWCRLFAIGRWF